MSDLDFLFVFPKFANGRSFEGFDYHLGSGYIRALLQSYGVHTEQFVHPGDIPLNQVADAIVARLPHILAFSVYDINYYFIKLLAEAVRQRSPKTVIICGGPTATFSPEIILQDCHAIDVCVRSYGEVAALEILQWARGERPLKSIPGITYLDGDRIVSTRGRSLNEALCVSESDGALPNFNLARSLHALDVFRDPYLTGLIPVTRISDIGIVTSRGCTFPCTFCNFSAMSERKISFHSIDRVIELLRFIEEEVGSGRVPKDNGDRKLVAINDDNFSLHPRRFHELIARMGKEQYQHIEFWAEMRTETMQVETFAMLKQASFGEINFGLESGVPHVLAAIKKVRPHGWEADDYRLERRFLDRIRWAVNEGQKVGLSTSVSIILGNPMETQEDGLATLKFVENLNVNRYAHNFLSVLAGTELATTYAQYGIRREPSPGKALPYWSFPTYDVYQLPILKHDQIWLPERGIEMVHVFRILSGSGNTDLGPALEHRLKGTTEIAGHLRSESDTKIVPLLVISNRALVPDVLTWLAHEMPMSSSVWIEHNDTETRAIFQEKLAKARIPVQEVNTIRYLQTDDRGEQIRINELSSTAPAFNTRAIHTIPAARADLSCLPTEVTEPRNTVLMTINSHQDVEALESILKRGEMSGVWRFPGSTLRARFSIADGCRWCGTSCPAGTGSLFFITDSGDVLPCKTGQSIGRVGEDFETIRARTRSMMERERERRGCAECPVADVCSQCLFPAPMDSSSFCTLRKAHPDFSTVMDGLVLARSLTHAGLLPRDVSNTLTKVGILPQEGVGCELRSLRRVSGSLNVRGESVPFARFVMLTFDGDVGGFLYLARRSLLVRLNAEQRLIVSTIADAQPLLTVESAV